MRTLFLAGPFVDSLFLFWAKTAKKRFFKRKNTQVMSLSLWLQVLEEYFLALAHRQDLCARWNQMIDKTLERRWGSQINK